VPYLLVFFGTFISDAMLLKSFNFSVFKQSSSSPLHEA